MRTMANGNERYDERRNIGHVEYVEAKAGELGHYLLMPTI